MPVCGIRKFDAFTVRETCRTSIVDEIVSPGKLTCKEADMEGARLPGSHNEHDREV